MWACRVLVLAIVFLGAPCFGQCIGDENGDNDIDLGEVQSAFNRYLNGCGKTLTPARNPTKTPTPKLEGDRPKLTLMIGEWRFSFTIISTFTNTYQLVTIDDSTDPIFLVGTDQFGDTVLVDVIADPTIGRTYALLDPAPILCDFFVFDIVRDGAVQGEEYEFNSDSFGNCTTDILGGPFPMTGTRTRRIDSANGAGAGTLPREIDEARQRLKFLEANTDGGGAAEIDPAKREALRTLINGLRR